MRQPKACEKCGAIMLVSPSRMSRKRFCSKACVGFENAERMNRIRKPAESNPSWFTSESARGENNPRWVPPVMRTCKHCATNFERKPWYIRIRGYVGDFCSVRCRDAFKAANLSGPNAPDWVGGITTYRGKGWEAARLLAVLRDAGTCQRCRVIVGDSIPVHHVTPFRLFESAAEANRLDNLLCLCQPCHMAIESRAMAA